MEAIRATQKELDAPTPVTIGDIDDIANKLKELMKNEPQYKDDPGLLDGVISSYKDDPELLKSVYNSSLPAPAPASDNTDIDNLCTKAIELKEIFEKQHNNFVKGTDNLDGLFNVVTKDIRNSKFKEISFGRYKFKNLPITGNGDCLYDTFTVGIVNNTPLENFKKNAVALGWNPKKYNHHIAPDGYPNYNGNLRSVLYDYICSNRNADDFPIQNVYDNGNMANLPIEGRLTEMLVRLKSVVSDKRGCTGGGWAENEEIQLLAKLFNVNIISYRLNGPYFTHTNKQGKQLDQELTYDLSQIQDDSIIYMLNQGGAHFDLLIPIDPRTGGSSTRKRRRGGGRRKSSTRKRR